MLRDTDHRYNEKFTQSAIVIARRGI